jgi:molybdenum cofactor guanylyltransferase
MAPGDRPTLARPHAVAAIILAGGTSQRMGTDKLVLTLEGRSLLQRAVHAARRVTDQVVVAGPPREALGDLVHFVGEDPPLGGPLAGLAAALEVLPADVDEVLVLAGDLAHPDETVDLLSSALAHPPVPDQPTDDQPTHHQPTDDQTSQQPFDGVALVDDEGFTQFLAARYLRPPLAALVGTPQQARDRGVHRALGSLHLRLIHAPTSAIVDLDTPEQARAAGVYDTL